MELVAFYWNTILVGSLMAMVLGLAGVHVVTRNKSLEALVVGQSLQTGIVVAALLMLAIFGDKHNEHGFHEEILLAMLISICFFSLYEAMASRKMWLKTEIGLAFLVFLQVASFAILGMVPTLDSHAQKAVIGDIVTATRLETLLIGAWSLVIFFYFWKKFSNLQRISLDLGLFGKTLTFNDQASSVIFNLIVFFSMSASIHVFGSLFTLGMMLIPITLANFIGIFRIEKISLAILIGNSSSVWLGFVANSFFPSLPTTALILLINLLIQPIFLFLFRVRKRSY